MHRARRRKLGNNMEGHNSLCPYNQFQPITKNFYKIVYDTLCTYSAFKYFLAFWGVTH